MLKFLIKNLTKKRVLSLFLSSFRLQIDRAHRRQKKVPKFGGGTTSGDANKIPES